MLAPQARQSFLTPAAVLCMTDSQRGTRKKHAATGTPLGDRKYPQSLHISQQIFVISILWGYFPCLFKT